MCLVTVEAGHDEGMDIDWVVLMSETGAETVPWRWHGSELRAYYETEDRVGHELELAKKGNKIELEEGWSKPDPQHESLMNIVVFKDEVLSPRSKGPGSAAHVASPLDQAYLTRLWKYASAVADKAGSRRH
jgi:hypothetical protein